MCKTLFNVPVDNPFKKTSFNRVFILSYKSTQEAYFRPGHNSWIRMKNLNLASGGPIVTVTRW